MLNYLKAYILYPAAERHLKRDIRSKLSALRHEHSLSRQERENFQQKLLHETLVSAGKHVPYYRDLFARLSFEPDNILKSADYLQELPFLTKEILRDQGIRMVNETMLGKVNLHERHTNGSTGLVTKVWYDDESLDWTAAVNLFASELSGRRIVDTEVHLSSHFINKIPRKDALKEQVKCWALNRVNVHTHTFDSAGLEELLRNLRRAKPYLIQGHPSTLYFLAIHLRETGGNARGLMHAFESTGESLDPAKAHLIAETFGCRVYNRYGNAEFGVVAHSLTDVSELEVLETIAFPESVAGDQGEHELVLTGLRNQAMPLIRYRTGDIGRVTSNQGRTCISKITGRIHDIVEIEGRTYPTHFIKDILERIGGIDEFQIVQRECQPELTLKVVPNEGFCRERVETCVRDLFGNSLRLETSGFDELLRQGWRDKFRYMVKAP
jgi:phenylacetate-CoA ligase